MTFVLVAVCIGIVAAGLGRLVVLRVVDERRSVRDYQQTLQTLRHLSDRADDAGSGIDGDGSEGQPVAGPARLPADPIRVRRPRPGLSQVSLQSTAQSPGSGAVPVSTGPVPTADASPSGRPSSALGGRRSGSSVDEATAAVFVFDDLAPPAPVGSGNPPASSATGRVLGALATASATSGRPGGQRSGRRVWAGRPLQTVTAVAAVVLVLALAATVVVTLRHHATTSALAVGASTPASGISSGSAAGSTPAKSSGGRSTTSGRRRRSGSTGSVPSTPSTVQPTSVTLYDATVPVSATAYQVAVSVTGNCWVEGEETATSTDVWSGVLTAGEQHDFAFTGPVLLRIGAADATVTLNGTPVALPSGYQAPYNLTFAPS